MSKKNYKKPQRVPSHPGSILRSGFIEPHDLRIETVASLLGISRGHLSRILNGKNPVTPLIAVKLEALTQTPASQWLKLQANYDSYLMAQDDTFKQYQSAIKEWSQKALSSDPEARRADPSTIMLVKQAGAFAGQLKQAMG